MMLDSILPDADKTTQDRLLGEVIDAYQELLPMMKPLIYDGVVQDWSNSPRNIGHSCSATVKKGDWSTS